MLPRCLISPVQTQAWRRPNVLIRRYLRSSPRHCAFVAPSDPVSNLRPVIYEDESSDHKGATGSGRGKGRGKGGDEEGEGEREYVRAVAIIERTRTSPTHPYLLDEFDGDPLDYQWRVERKRLDAYNHAFWTDSNHRFEAAKRAVLSSLPENAPPEVHEAALSEFYGKWLRQEHGRLKDYSDDWNRRNFGGIMLAARAAIRQFRARFFGRPTTILSYPSSSHPRRASTKLGGEENRK
ncbi:hypothetical protein EW145_g258 [Phellinidium pouzarii]|uniref:Uncharacterized protein n=1 Tax=Phellinidium pouzarii TaxID=167371 RepID=A0A4S4LPF0_9AGAM|nr:hypothetical protein EW145_g258 [Phellinidium pouzarii]